MVKHQLRLSLQKTLLAMSSKQRKEKSKKACQNLIGTRQFQEASTIMMFLSLPHEVCTNEAILCAWQLGKTVAVPKISWQQKHMLPVQINTLEDGFSTEVAGLRNPIKGSPVPFEEIDLVVTPGLAFDRQGNRLGRGGGYYDRFFTNEKLKRQRCGFAFAEQLIDSVPISERDERVDLLVTDEQVIYFDTGNQ
ncbi:MAG: 5-formyltetrahydrofolate cyclo-ligase [Planctomycetota bacterium]|jgi:5-formyltetrahydrofolate cyclo-ligase